MTEEGTVAELARLIPRACHSGGKCGKDDAKCGRHGEWLPASSSRIHVIAGVILNNVAGDPARGQTTRAVETHCGIPVLGTIPKDARLGITERHLGLVPTAEREEADDVIDTICERVESHLDLDGLMEVARKAPAMTAMLAPVEAYPATCAGSVLSGTGRSASTTLTTSRRSGAQGRRWYLSIPWATARCLMWTGFTSVGDFPRSTRPSWRRTGP